VPAVANRPAADPGGLGQIGGDARGWESGSRRERHRWRFRRWPGPAAKSAAGRLPWSWVAGQASPSGPGRSIALAGPASVTDRPDKLVHHPRRLEIEQMTVMAARLLAAADMQLCRRGAGPSPDC
jgi:hypothetical protein